MARFSATTVALAALALLNLLGTGPVPCAADVALGTPASAQNETLTMGAPSPSPPPPPPSAQDYFVGELPGMQLDTFNTTLRMHAGYVTVQQPQDQQLFFWQFDATVRRDRNVLLIWLNGGPGCSSLDGLFLENGPLKVIDKDHVAWNPYGWNQYADVLYVDQPAGTGFSTGQIKDYAHTETEIVERFLSFYDRYLEIFPQHRDAELYFAGESYAGTYLPYITAAMLKRNEAAGRDIYRIQSLLIGNGWIDPLRQYAGYETFAVANGLLPLGTSYATLYQERWAKCAASYEKSPNRIHHNDCEELLSVILDVSRDETQHGHRCINMYDIRFRDPRPQQSCGADTWPVGLPAVGEYLARPDVLKALHVDPNRAPWRECNDDVGGALAHDTSAPASTLLPYILSKTKVTLFNGDRDLICAWFGSWYMAGNLTWNGARGLADADRYDWYLDGRLVGWKASARNLTYITVHNASHMVPLDLPDVALEILHTTIGYADPGANLLRPVGKVDADPTRMLPSTTTLLDGVPMHAMAEYESLISDKELWSLTNVVTLLLVLLAVVILWRYWVWQRRVAHSARRSALPTNRADVAHPAEPTEWAELTHEPEALYED